MKQAISKIDPAAALNELEANGKLEASVAVVPKLKTGKTEKDGKKERKKSSARRRTKQEKDYPIE